MQQLSRMIMQRHKWLETLLVSALLLTLTACTAKLMYRNLDWAVLEFIEDYVSLDGDQEEILELQLKQFTEWHKTEELPRYEAQLQSLYDADLSLIDEEFLIEQHQMFRTHIKRLANEITPELYSLSRSMSKEQIDEFLQNLTEQHEEYSEKYSQTSERETRTRYKERIEKNLRRLLGTLSIEQKNIAYEWSSSIERTHQDWGLYRIETRDRIKTMFARRDDPFFYQKELTTLINNPEQGYSNELIGKLERNRALANQSILAIISTASAEQKQHFKEEIKDWLELVQELQSD
ncbi:DUF6279 family lipoprotein [Vibrio breoganii]|uniref:DUF6279 family lipoprotein n=1 Tax=Vibrio breoganii TaxID=553239 RepID=UPI000C85F0DD|nr:DUF6279 family lipoprotein [Vibrio breoganii]PMG85228.1 hypothetical protein BCU81_13165 [Vibrio breoganii]PMG91434.1 hypothetical protein BCU79_17285 [Vibrio breoganii]PMJ43974.1 hypothetical protein BCU21_16620 [Vibrio breoganii]PML36231.1 hypothetical protein BCT78_10400 [Vibrio breoganii]PML84455.1 hypothetical protein BCT68_08540 [Vibrio breoganii]